MFDKAYSFLGFWLSSISGYSYVMFIHLLYNGSLFFYTPHFVPIQSNIFLFFLSLPFCCVLFTTTC